MLCYMLCYVVVLCYVMLMEKRTLQVTDFKMGTLSRWAQLNHVKLPSLGASREALQKKTQNSRIQKLRKDGTSGTHPMGLPEDSGVTAQELLG